MAGPGTTFTGPVMSGTQKDTTATSPSNLGICELTQAAQLTQNGSTAVSTTFTVPADSQLLDFLVDVTTAWNSGSATFTAGTSAADTSYASGVAVTATGRQTPAYTGTQLKNMYSVGSNTSVVATITPGGTAATAGTVNVTLRYIQRLELTQGTA